MIKQVITTMIRFQHLLRACAVQTRMPAAYYLARMLYAGEDVRFIARRILICASEDVGNADPQALTVVAIGGGTGG